MYSQAITQSCIVFIFLTLFFFNYVSNIEKEEYKAQLELMVDDLFEELNIKPIDDKSKKDLIKVIIYGIIGIGEDEIENNTKDTVKMIDKSNQLIVNQSYTLMAVYIVMSIIFLVILHHFGECFSMGENIKEGLFMLLFIFCVEFLFLNLIAKHYIAGNLNMVKENIVNVILEYIKERNKK